MKATYRGVEIEAVRERAMGGWDEVYWTAYRVSDGYGVRDGFGGGTVRECFKELKEAVDEFLDTYEGNADWHGAVMEDYHLKIGGMRPWGTPEPTKEEVMARTVEYAGNNQSSDDDDDGCGAVGHDGGMPGVAGVSGGAGGGGGGGWGGR